MSGLLRFSYSSLRRIWKLDSPSIRTRRFTRNEILTTNEVRQAIGMKTSTDPNADELRNKNLYAPEEEYVDYAPENQNGGYPNYEENV